MTNLIHDRDLDLSGLTPLQQDMIKELAAQVNGICAMGQATPDQLAEVFNRLAEVIARLNESNRVRS